MIQHDSINLIVFINLVGFTSRLLAHIVILVITLLMIMDILLILLLLLQHEKLPWFVFLVILGILICLYWLCNGGSSCSIPGNTNLTCAVLWPIFFVFRNILNDLARVSIINLICQINMLLI